MNHSTHTWNPFSIMIPAARKKNAYRAHRQVFKCNIPQTDPTMQRMSNVGVKLERCIDDERKFKTAKRSQAPGDATVLKRFCYNFVIFRRR